MKSLIQQRVLTDPSLIVLWQQFTAYVQGSQAVAGGDDAPDDFDTHHDTTESASGLIEPPLPEKHTKQVQAEIARRLPHLLPPAYTRNGTIEPMKFYSQYRFSGNRSLPTIRTGSPVGHTRSRRADALLLHSSVTLASTDCVWADLEAVIQVTVRLPARDPKCLTFLLVRPYKMCPSAQRGTMVDSITGMPLVVRPGPDAECPPLIVSPSEVVSPVHVIDLPATFNHPDAATCNLCYINWFIFRSQWKYPVEHRDKMLGLRGHRQVPL